MRTTIGIPLHEAWRWREVVAGNIERLSQIASIVVSDATESDDALKFLKTRFADTKSITWLRKRKIRPGWVGHCNDLLNRASSEFFMWLPQDDEIGPEWVSQAEAKLDEEPNAVLVHGPIESIIEEGTYDIGRVLEPYPMFTQRDVRTRMYSGLVTCLLEDTSRLGAAFRGVQRRNKSVPLPTNSHKDEWVDIFWALRMLGRGTFETMSAVYRKRWYQESTHRTWGDARLYSAFRTVMIPDAVVDIDADTRESLITESWEIERSRWLAEKQSLEAERDRWNSEASSTEDPQLNWQERENELYQEIERLKSEAHYQAVAEIEKMRAAFEQSRSWKVTAPLRAVTSRFRKH
ncbi:MAG: glycosyltransferase [Cryobacterium sp.]|nr:glycosyltransferase [Cryobacterium sp.]